MKQGDVVEVQGVGTFIVGYVTPVNRHGRYDIRLDRKFNTSIYINVRTKETR